MNNLFRIFEPSTSIFFRLNWLRIFLFLFFIPSRFFLQERRYEKGFSLIKAYLFNEFVLPLYPAPGKNLTNFSITLFFFILIINFLGLLPYVFTPTRNISITLRLAITLWFRVILGTLWINLNSFLVHLVPSGTPLILIPLIVLIELVRNLIRPITLSVRLAANIVAGHLLISLINGSAYARNFLTIILIRGVILIILECSVAVIQAYVFSTLGNLYLSELNSEVIY